MSAGPIIQQPLKPAWDWPDYGSAADRDRERAPGMSDEWTDDEPAEPSEAWKIMREASRMQSDALRALAGHDFEQNGEEG